MKYSDWIKKYCTKTTDNPMDDLFFGFERWCKDRPDVAVPSEFGMQDVFKILEENGVEFPTSQKDVGNAQ